MIKVKYGNGVIEVESDVNLSYIEHVNGLIRVIESIKSTVDKLTVTKIETSTVSVFDDTKDKRSVSDDMPTERKRLPNKLERETNSDGKYVGNNSNVIDLSKMTVDSNKVTPYDVFRCPDCGQSILAHINNVNVIRDLDVEGNLAIILGYCIKKGLKDFDYKEAQKYVTDVGVKLAGDGNTHVHCCKCDSKGEDKLIETWVDAYKNPLNYFEFDCPCPICGSETAMLIEQNSSEEKLKCENNSCNYTSKK